MSTTSCDEHAADHRSPEASPAVPGTADRTRDRGRQGVVKRRCRLSLQVLAVLILVELAIYTVTESMGVVDGFARWTREHELLGIEGLAIPAIVAVAVLTLTAGWLAGFAESGRESLVRAERALVQANDAKSLFLANISHEVRTPLTGLVASFELLEESVVDEAQAKVVGIMRHSLARLESLIEDLLDFSTLEAEGLSLESVSFSPAQLVGETVTSLAVTTRPGGPVVDWTVDATVPTTVMGDPHRTRQVLGNLLDNAVKFTAEGHVRLAVTTGSGPAGRAMLVFSVEDTGIGITEEQLDQLFEPFTQADGSATRRFGGTGLGLAVCQRLATLMGGTIRVESTPGVGSTFSFAMPQTSAAGAVRP